MGLEDNTAYYSQEKKLWVNMVICLISPRPSVSQTAEASTPFESIKRSIYILIEKCCSSLLQPQYNTRTALTGNADSSPTAFYYRYDWMTGNKLYP